MNMLFKICIDKNNPAQIWLTYTFRQLSSVNVHATMICIINDWINVSFEIHIDKKPCINTSKPYHQAFKLDNFNAVKRRSVNDWTRYQCLIWDLFRWENPAQIWVNYTIKHLNSVHVYAVTIIILSVSIKLELFICWLRVFPTLYSGFLWRTFSTCNTGGNLVLQGYGRPRNEHWYTGYLTIFAKFA